MKLLSFSDRGAALAEGFAAAFPGATHTCAHGTEGFSLRAWTAAAFAEEDALVFVGAAGIAVRAIAPFVQSKTTDPAVVAVDECGRFVLPLLSGHLGGANALAEQLAALCGGTAVITTATDCHGLFAVDSWAKTQGLLISNPEAIKTVSAKLLSGETVYGQSPWRISGAPPHGVLLTEDAHWDFALTVRQRDGDGLGLIPPILVLGIGCRRGTTTEAIETAFQSLLRENRLCEQAICLVCSIDLKEKEPGLLEFCDRHALPFQTFSAGDLQEVAGTFSASPFVESVTGVSNVCERSAVRGSGGTLLVKKTAGNGVTMAVAQRPFFPDWRV
ncbi:MAG: cobalt-precorrin 5A hydrolase [Oscillospiraceae bacterium]